MNVIAVGAILIEDWVIIHCMSLEQWFVVGICVLEIRTYYEYELFVLTIITFTKYFL